MPGPGPEPDVLADPVGRFLKSRRAENTRAAYRRDLDQFFAVTYGYDRPTHGPVPGEALPFVTSGRINDFKDWLQEQLDRDGNPDPDGVDDEGAPRFAPKTVQRKLSTLSSFFEFACAHDLVRKNPVHRDLVVRPKRGEARPALYLTAIQAARLLDAAAADEKTGPRDAAIVAFLLYCWLRRSEAAAMDFEHIDEVEGVHRLYLPDTKAGGGATLKVHPECVARLDRVREAYGWGSGPCWRSLSNRDPGRRLTPKGIYRIVKKAAARAGVVVIGAHTLRHTGINQAVRADAPVDLVRAHARHASLETTMRYVKDQAVTGPNAADYLDFQ